MDGDSLVDEIVRGHVTIVARVRAQASLQSAPGPNYLVQVSNGGPDRILLEALRDGPVCPTPATHAILVQLKAGETVYQAGELPKTPRVPKIHYEPPKTVCETAFASIFPPSMENGDGTRVGLRGLASWPA